MQNRAFRKARIEEADIAQPRRIGAHREIPEDGVARPADIATGAELRAREPDARQIHIERAAVDRHPACESGDGKLRVATLGRVAQDIDTNAVLAGRLDAERR